MVAEVQAQADAAALLAVRPAVLQAQDEALVAVRRRLWLPASIQALRLAVAELPPLRLSPRGSWSSRLTEWQLCLRLLPRLLPQQRRPPELPQRVAAVAAEPVAVRQPRAAVAVEQAAAVALRLPLYRFPELDRSLPERLWSHGIR